jgi:hypothetical protein
MANETNNATVTGLITLAKGCFMFHGPVRVVDHEVSRIEKRHALRKHDTAGLQACTDIRQ